MSLRTSVRPATHAGSWYPDSPKELNRQLDIWLNACEPTNGPARAIIAPHAGYQYCGPCSAHAYAQVRPDIVQRVFILGPSHHVRLSGCALTTATRYRTPQYDLQIDSKVQTELDVTGLFEWMTHSVDENEHSIELHLPFIAKIMEKKPFTIVPVLVGSLTPEKEALYGGIFSRYLSDPHTLFVISSDFCHWGHRFRYTYYDRSFGDIHQSIKMLDKRAMDIIEHLNPVAFVDYLRKSGNTICGRHPIGILLHAARILQERGRNGPKMSLKFLNYSQSNRCCNVNDSSVSYAAASLLFE